MSLSCFNKVCLNKICLLLFSVCSIQLFCNDQKLETQGVFLNPKKKIGRTTNDIKEDIANELKQFVLFSSELVATVTELGNGSCDCKKTTKRVGEIFDGYRGMVDGLDCNFSIDPSSKKAGSVKVTSTGLSGENKYSNSKSLSNLCSDFVIFVSRTGIPCGVKKTIELFENSAGCFFSSAKKIPLEECLLRLRSTCRTLESTCLELSRFKSGGQKISSGAS